MTPPPIARCTRRPSRSRLGGALGALVALALAATPLYADQRPHNSPRPPPPRRTHHAPELDPSLATAAAALLVGGVLMLTDRRRRARLAR